MTILVTVINTGQVNRLSAQMTNAKFNKMPTHANDRFLVNNTHLSSYSRPGWTTQVVTDKEY